MELATARVGSYEGANLGVQGLGLCTEVDTVGHYSSAAPQLLQSAGDDETLAHACCPSQQHCLFNCQARLQAICITVSRQWAVHYGRQTWQKPAALAWHKYSFNWGVKSCAAETERPQVAKRHRSAECACLVDAWECCRPQSKQHIRKGLQE